MTDFKLSIIIPAYQEAKNLSVLLPFLFEKNREPFLEVVVVDASEDHETLKELQRTFKFCKSCSSKSYQEGRGDCFVCAEKDDGMVKVLRYKRIQRKERSFLMNEGRRLATGNVLFFLFADAMPPDYYSTMICNYFREGYRFLAFEHEYRSDLPLLSLVENAANFRLSNFSFFYGDHGIVISREFFDGIGGFPEVPIFEDAIFTNLANDICALKVIKEKLLISDRKYRTHGVIKVTAVNLLVTSLWVFNLDLNRIHKVYKKLLRNNPQDQPKKKLLLSHHT